ncbi:MAG TPA: DUF4031 domain-containing protein [Pseudonocardiaceae bacterium]
MTVYVDDARIPARVGRLTDRWSHLVTDSGDVTELHLFARRLGLRLAWFQPGRTAWRPHYDLTNSRRTAALHAGATPCRWAEVPQILARAREDQTANGRRVLVTGSRTWTDRGVIADKLREAARAHPGATLVHGAARGADRIAAAIWRRWGLPTEPHPVGPADWDRDGPSAGHVRNRRMVALGADLCVAFIHNNSPGATGCADHAERAGIPTDRTHHQGDQ